MERRTLEEEACLALAAERQPLEDQALRHGALASWWSDAGVLHVRLPGRRDPQPLRDAGAVVLPTRFTEGGLAAVLRQVAEPLESGVRWTYAYVPEDDVVHVVVDGPHAALDRLARRHGEAVRVRQARSAADGAQPARRSVPPAPSGTVSAARAGRRR